MGVFPVLASFLEDKRQPTKAEDILSKRFDEPATYQPVAQRQMPMMQQQQAQQQTPDLTQMLQQLEGLSKPTMNDVGRSAMMSFINQKYESPQDMATGNLMQKLKMVEALSGAKANMARAQGIGSGGGSTLAAAEKIMESTGVDFPTAWSIAKSGLGPGNTLANGQITNIPGAPDAFSNIERGKGFGRERGKDQATAAMQLPSELDMGERTMRYIEEMVGSNALGTGNGIPQHPGLNAAIGTVDTWFPTVRPQTKDFENRLEQVKGTAFLQAIQKLKGTGQITEIEGRAGTAAVTRMQNAGSEQEFVNAAREYYDIVRTGMERARQASGGMQQPSAAPAMGAQPVSEPTATGRNGEKIVFRNGRWQPLQ